MISVLSYNRSKDEQLIIEQGCRDLTGRKTEERLSIYRMIKSEELEGAIHSDEMIHFIYYEILDNRDIQILKAIRMNNKMALLMLLTSPSISPMQYLKPGVSPDALLLRPFGKKEFDEVNEELFDAYIEKQSDGQDEQYFVIRTREERCRILYSKILFFEAKNKKIVVRVGCEEYEIYDSIDNIAKMVPEYFVRTHRSYLVNTRKVRQIDLAEGVLKLDQCAVVPISRTYKREVKERLQ